MTEVNRPASDPTLIERVAGRDRSAAAEFYDSQAPRVRTYCQELCLPELTDDATLAAFVDFLGRATTAAPDADAEDLLRRATRTAASARMDLRHARQPECIAVPELMAAKISGELPRDDKSLREHVVCCPLCEETVQRLERAEATLARPPGAEPPIHLRRAWLDLVAAEVVSPSADHPESAAKSADVKPPDDRAPKPPPAQIRVKARRGGLVGAARRLGSSRRR